MSKHVDLTPSCWFIEGNNCYQVAMDFSGPLVAIIIFFASIWLALWKLSEQHTASLKQQDEELRKKFKIEVFKELNETLNEVQDVLQEHTTFYFVKKYGGGEEGIVLTAQERNDLSYNSIDALLKIILRIESLEVVNPLLFQTVRFALQSIVHDIQELRREDDDNNFFEALYNSLEDAKSYLVDFQICLQNFTWGKIFDASVESRVPIDPNNKVIVDGLDELSELNNFFKNETPWGRNNARLEA